jgi:hypothetical protein
VGKKLAFKMIEVSVLVTSEGDVDAVPAPRGPPGNEATTTGLSRDAFISGALRELGVALCRGNASLGRSGLYALTRVSGRAPLHSLSCPSTEVV